MGKFLQVKQLHNSHGGLTPYKIFRAKMNIHIQSQSKFEV